MTAVKQRANNRVEALLDSAAVLFADQGYHRTTIRDITSALGMGPGSSYYHFASKAEMLVAIYEQGVQTVTTAVTGRTEDHTDPWDSIAAALKGHIEAVLAPSAYARVIVTVLPDDVPDVAQDLQRMRDEYEQLWKKLLDDLDLKVDTQLLRFFLLGAANYTQVWFRPGALSPADIAKTFISFLRQPLEHP